MDGIDPATLRDRDGAEFRFVDVSGKATVLRLRSITERVEGGGGALLTEFEADEPHGLGQGTYDVTSAGLAPTPLFAVPISPTELCVTFTWLAPPADGA